MRKKYAILLTLAVAALLFAFRGFRQVVPAGLRLRSVEPFYLWSRDLGTFPSPEGGSEVRILVNDAGAMHSGNHWAWIVQSSPLKGQRILAQGYVAFADSNRERFPLRWVSESQVEVTFCKGRRSAEQVTHILPASP